MDNNDNFIKMMVGIGDVMETSMKESNNPNQFESLDSVIESFASHQDTGRIIAALMRESTGASILDSGGIYGRNWERNRGRDFENEPTVYLSFEYDYIDYTLNVYHFLNERLDYAPQLDKEFLEFSDREDQKDSHWLENMEAFAEYIRERDGMINGQAGTVNTYNGEDNLSQVLQYTMGESDEGTFYLVQIHGGADVRGGYTRPVAFLADEYALFDNAGGYIRCDCQTSWYTDDSYHWYTDADIELQDCKFVDVEELSISQQMDLWLLTSAGGPSPEVKEVVEQYGEHARHSLGGWRKGHKNPNKVARAKNKRVLYIRDGKAICPVCNQNYLKG